MFSAIRMPDPLSRQVLKKNLWNIHEHFLVRPLTSSQNLWWIHEHYLILGFFTFSSFNINIVKIYSSSEILFIIFIIVN